MIFGIFKDKGAEKTALLINKEFDKLLNVGKKGAKTMYTVKSSIFKKEYKSYDLKQKKNEIIWTIESNENKFEFLVPGNLNKDVEIIPYIAQCICNDMDCHISILCAGHKRSDKRVMCGADATDNFPIDQSKAINIKNELIEKYGFIDGFKDTTT